MCEGLMWYEPHSDPQSIRSVVKRTYGKKTARVYVSARNRRKRPRRRSTDGAHRNLDFLKSPWPGGVRRRPRRRRWHCEWAASSWQRTLKDGVRCFLLPAPPRCQLSSPNSPPRPLLLTSSFMISSSSMKTHRFDNAASAISRSPTLDSLIQGQRRLKEWEKVANNYYVNKYTIISCIVQIPL
jgi:hypothetical protein